MNDEDHQEEKSYDAKSLWEDLIEGHKILNSTNNLKSFQLRPDDKASEHELKLQINTLGTDVGKNFFPQHRKFLNVPQKPSKVTGNIEDTI